MNRRDTDHSRDLRPVVCQVVHTLGIGGGEILARDIALKAEPEIRPVFALLDSLGELGRELADGGYDVEVIGRRPGVDLRCALSLRAFIREHNATLIHAHQYGPLFYSALARLPKSSLPILFTEHGRDVPDFRRRKRVWANKLLLTRQDEFVAVGKDVARALVEYEGLPADQVRVIYNGRELSDFDPDRPLRNVVRSELGIPVDSFVAIQVARLDRLKDHATALRVVHRVSDQIRRFRLVLVGDGVERRRLEDLAKELGIEREVLFLGSRTDVPRLLQAADVFLLTSISEGIPLTIIEAMATRLPCVGTSVGGVPELLTEGETGLMRPAGDRDGLADRLLELAADPDLCCRLGESGYLAAVDCHDSSRMHRQYLELYRKMTLGTEVDMRIRARSSS